MTEQTLPWVEGAGPGPPWWKQAARWWTLIGITLSILILTSEISLLIRSHSVQWALDQISDQVETVKGEISKAEGASKVANDVLGSIQQSEKNLKIKTTALGLIRDGLHLRSEYSKALFLGLSHSVSPNVAVNEFREERDHSVNLEAWAVTEKEAQEFIQSLVESLSKWGLTPSLQQVRLQTGRLGLPGYHIELELRPNPTFSKSSKKGN